MVASRFSRDAEFGMDGNGYKTAAKAGLLFSRLFGTPEGVP